MRMILALGAAGLIGVVGLVYALVRITDDAYRRASGALTRLAATRDAAST